MPLPLTNLSGFGSGESGPLDLAYQGTSASNSTTVSFDPGLVAVGDFVVLVGTVRGGTMPAPSGFTTAYSASVSTTTRVWIGYAVMTSLSSVSWPSGSLQQAWAYYVFRPTKAITSVAVHSGNAIATDGNPAATTLGGTIAGPVVYAAGLFTNINLVSPRTWSGMTEQQIASLNWAWAAYAFWALGATSSSISVDMDDEGTGNCVACAAFTFT